MRNKDKPQLVKFFLSGQRIADVAVYFCLTQARVEAILRDAITQLSHLNTSLALTIRGEAVSDASPEESVIHES